MGKELVVTANRHETKVAILEDDQLVEIFFQRANEYSLAGSIHKGRVTRVLPGMQSAFVDLGLERDTFLYVSDFFEENEEYEAVATEEKVRRVPERGERGERGERSERAERGDRPERGERPERPERSERQERPERQEAPMAPASLTPPAQERPAGAPPVAAGPGEGRQDDQGGDRRGRRSRRRRGRGGRGFPDSKYASDGPAARPEESAEETEPEIVVAEAAEEIILLPGESLAKYRRNGESETESDQEEADIDPAESAAYEEEPVEISPAHREPEAVRVNAASEEAASALDEAILERVEAAVLAEEPEIAMRAGASAGADQETDEEEAPVADREPEVRRLDPAGDLIEEQLLAAAEGELAAVEAPEEGLAEDELESEAEAEAEPEMEAGVEGEITETIAEESEAPEPARIPQSLTATLREQGGRYPHRASRRMRRRRGGFEGRNEGQTQGAPRQAEAPAAPPPPPVVRDEARTAVRPDKVAPQISITDLLKEGQEILVQIAKEPLGQKGARITSHIALPGRYVVYMPTVEHLGVSRKIGTDEERLRLKRILQTHRVGIPGGFIMRTAGEGKSEEEIAADMTYLFNLWLDIRQKAEKRNAPALIHHDLDIVQRILRDQFAENFKAIWVDNEDVYESILHFVQRFQPNLVGKVKMYTRPIPIFDSFNITAELEKALRPKVWLKSGGYIVINQTEALVAIDVNTGKYVGKSNRLEDTIVKTNTEAVKEIVRQVRLRDLGGIIVVDFIDMDERKNRQKVMQALEEAMRADKAPNKILQFNDFGLVAITRKRVKQSLERTLCAPCPYCEGAGYVKSVSTVVGEILQEAAKIVGAVEGKDCMLRVNPEVGKFLKSTDNKYLEELEGILGRPVLVVSDARLHQEKFDLT